MFLDGTYHVLLIYIVFGLILCLPPLLLPQWKSLVQRFNKKDVRNKNSFRLFLLVSGLTISIIAIIFMCLHHPFMFDVEFAKFEAEYLFFNFYSFFSFILLPLALAMIGGASYLRHSSNPKRGNFILIFLGMFALGLGGSFLHDIIWCGTRTSFYTQQIDAGYDLDWWRNLLGVASKDYRMFGFYMFVLTIILLCFATIMLKKHELFLEEKYNQNTRRGIFILASLDFILLGLGLYIMEYWRIFTIIPAIIGTFIHIPLTLVLSHYLGKSLANA